MGLQPIHTSSLHCGDCRLYDGEPEQKICSGAALIALGQLSSQLGAEFSGASPAEALRSHLWRHGC